MGWRGEWDAFFGHAVKASKVAALRDADAEVIMLTREGIGQEGGEGFGSFECFSPLCMRFGGY